MTDTAQQSIPGRLTQEQQREFLSELAKYVNEHFNRNKPREPEGYYGFVLDYIYVMETLLITLFMNVSRDDRGFRKIIMASADNLRDVALGRIEVQNSGEVPRNN